jgi:hypothetical protein
MRLAAITFLVLFMASCQDFLIRPISAEKRYGASAGYIMTRTSGVDDIIKSMSPYYTSKAELVAFVEKKAKDRHVEPDYSRITEGGQIECLVYAIVPEQLAQEDLIVLRGKEVIGRAKLPLAEAGIRRDGGTLYYWGSVLVKLKDSPSDESPVIVECLEGGNLKSSYVVTISPRPVITPPQQNPDPPRQYP